MCLLATGLLVLDFVVLPLKATCLSLSSHHFFDKGLGPILSIDPGAEPFRGTFNDCSDFGKSGHFVLARGFLVVPMRIENGSHLDDLQVTL